MKLLLAVILVPFAGLLVLVLAYKLVFLGLSRRGTAIVTHTALHQQVATALAVSFARFMVS